MNATNTLVDMPLEPRPFELDALRRNPDVEAPNLYAVDAADRLLLDTAADLIEAEPARAHALVVIGDHYGALTLGAITRFDTTGVRTNQDPLSGELALRHNAERTGLDGHYANHALAPELVAGARLVLVQAPKSLLELTEITQLVAEHAAPDVVILLGGRVKYLTKAMNDVLGRCFADVRAGLARQKSRVIFAGDRKAEIERVEFPQQRWHPDVRLWVCAYGAAFAGTAIDIGTRRLIDLLDDLPDAEQAIDLGCGTGVLATLLARSGRTVLATDQSAAACASARATAAANEVTVTVDRDNALANQPEASADLILCNPPFHLGTAVHAGAAGKLFDGAGRVLVNGGQLWTVFNNHLGYRVQLQRLIGPSRVVHQDAKFTVVASTRQR